MTNPSRLPYRVKRKWWQFWKPRYGMEFREFEEEFIFKPCMATKIKEPHP